MANDIFGLPSLKRKYGQLNERTKSGMENGMRRSGGAVHRRAAAIVPVDTGRLKNSIFDDDPYWRNNTIFEEIGTNVEYAYPVEKRQPYLEPALLDERRTINDIFVMELKTAQNV